MEDHDDVVIIGLCQYCGRQYVKANVREMHAACTNINPAEAPIIPYPPAQPS